MAATVECLKMAPMKLGDGPHWQADAQCLFLVDTCGTLVKHIPRTGRTVFHIFDERTSFIIPVKGRENEYVVGSKYDVLQIEWDPDSNKILKRQTLISLKDESPKNTINEAKCDAKGRLWFGTHGERIEEGGGALYSFSRNGGLVKHVTNISLANGISFSPDNKRMYLVDSMDYKVLRYDFDINKGTIKLKSTVIDFRKDNLTGMPDGMTVDSKGRLWIACLFGSHIIQVDPENGKRLRSIKFEKSNLITSLAFGGSNLDELFVTSGNIPEKTFNCSEAGCTYKVTELEASGLLPNEFDPDV